MNNLLRMASLELQSLPNNEVVKIAGVLNKLKNYLKQLGDREYANAVDALRSDSWMLQQVATELRKKIKELTEAIDDGDISSYDMVLEEIRGLTTDLATELRNLNQDAKENDPRLQTTDVKTSPESNIPKSTSDDKVDPTLEESNRYTREQWDDPNKRIGIFEQVAKMIKFWHPNHDVPIGKNINKPLHDFHWFDDKEIHIKQGSDSGAKNRLIDQTARLLVRETSLSYDDVISAFENNANFDELAKRLVNAIYNGTLLHYIPATPMKEPKDKDKVWVRERQIGEMAAAVKTAEFSIPVFDVSASMTVGLIDMGAPANGTNKLVLGFTEYSRVAASGVPPALRKGFVRKPEEIKTEEPKINLEESPVTITEPESPKKKVRKRVARLASLRNLIKTSRVNFSAAEGLSDTFWIKFVEMSNRLGANPEDLAQVINSESGFDAHATNVQDGKVIAKGLNQLIEKTAKALGMSDEEWKRYEFVPAEDQLKYVEKFFKSVGKITGVGPKWNNATQLYVANFAPKYVAQASNPNTVLYSESENKDQYEKNKGLDRDKKGHITAGDLARSVQSKKMPNFISESLNRAKLAVNSNQTTVNHSSNNDPDGNDDNINGLLNTLFALDAGPIEKMVRTAIEERYLPISNVLVTVSSFSAPYDVRIKFAQVVTNLIKEILNGDTSIHSDGNKVELQCFAVGSQYAVSSAIKALCDCVVKAINLRFSGIEVRCILLPSTISKYAKVGE